MRLQSILKGLVLATVTVWPAPRAAADPVRLLDDAVKALRSGNLSGALQRTREAEFELQQQLLNASPPPQQQTAPPVARFNSPLVVPLDSTASVLDFVSFPEGDRIDQVHDFTAGAGKNII